MGLKKPKHRPLLPKVHSKYGAPMGRREYGVTCAIPFQILLRKIAINNGGYDEGGAYWGIGAPIWWAYCESEHLSYQHFTRAHTRWRAATNLELTNFDLWIPEPGLPMDELQIEMLREDFKERKEYRTARVEYEIQNISYYRICYRSKLFVAGLKKSDVAKQALLSGFTHIVWPNEKRECVL